MIPTFINTNSELYEWILFPLFIFICRICDVSLSTLRSVLSAKGKKKIVPYIGFFEVLLWILAVSSILKNLNNAMCYIAFASGYAVGIYVGLVIEEKLAIGTQVIRIITNQKSTLIVDALNAENYGSTCVDAEGARGPVKMIFTIVKRKEVPHVIDIIHQHSPNAFYSIEDCKNASQVRYDDGNQKNKWSLLAMLKK
jgi:uncharacterized protein YebE (UPF0316 family)